MNEKSLKAVTKKKRTQVSKVSLNPEEESLRLFTVIGTIPENEKKIKNKSSSWVYGYNAKYDVVIISKTGKVGEVINVNGLKIALPLQPKKVH